MTEPVELPDEARPPLGVELVPREDGLVSVTIIARPLDLGIVFNPAYAKELIDRVLPPQEDSE